MDREKKLRLSEQKPLTSAPVEVRKNSCNNCLWVGVECKNGKDYIPGDSIGECKSWVYYD